MDMVSIEDGQKVSISVGAIEFYVGGNTIWIQGMSGGTTLRIQCAGRINVDICNNSPVSHADISVPEDINFCLS